MNSYVDIWPFAALLYERCKQVYGTEKDPAERETLALHARMIYEAIRKAAVYTVDKTMEEISDYATGDRRRAFMTSVKDNTCAIHNSADDCLPESERQENAILFDYVVNDFRAGFLFIRSEDTLSASGFTYYEKEHKIVVWPWVFFIDRVTLKAGLTKSPLLNHKGSVDLNDPALQDIMLSYLDAYVFLNDAIALERETGSYGFGVHWLSILALEFLFPTDSILYHQFQSSS